MPSQAPGSRRRGRASEFPRSERITRRGHAADLSWPETLQRCTGSLGKPAPAERGRALRIILRVLPEPGSEGAADPRARRDSTADRARGAGGGLSDRRRRQSQQR